MKNSAVGCSTTGCATSTTWHRGEGGGEAREQVGNGTCTVPQQLLLQTLFRRELAPDSCTTYRCSSQAAQQYASSAHRSPHLVGGPHVLGVALPRLALLQLTQFRVSSLWNIDQLAQQPSTAAPAQQPPRVVSGVIKTRSSGATHRAGGARLNHKLLLHLGAQVRLGGGVGLVA